MSYWLQIFIKKINLYSSQPCSTHLYRLKNSLKTKKLDESKACQHLKSPQSLPGRSLHLTLVTKSSRSWSWMTESHPFCSVSIDPPIPEIQLFQNLTLKIQGRGQGQSQSHWSYLRPRVQSICLLFISWLLDKFLLRYSKFHIWPWKFKEGQAHGQIQWCLEFNQYICFLFSGNQTILGWDRAKFHFHLEHSRSRSWRKTTKI